MPLLLFRLLSVTFDSSCRAACLTRLKHIRQKLQFGLDSQFLLPPSGGATPQDIPIAAVRTPPVGGKYRFEPNKPPDSWCENAYSSRFLGPSVCSCDICAMRSSRTSRKRHLLTNLCGISIKADSCMPLRLPERRLPVSCRFARWEGRASV